LYPFSPDDAPSALMQCHCAALLKIRMRLDNHGSKRLVGHAGVANAAEQKSCKISVISHLFHGTKYHTLA
jgi:hypothetical protein